MGQNGPKVNCANFIVNFCTFLLQTHSIFSTYILYRKDSNQEHMLEGQTEALKDLKGVDFALLEALAAQEEEEG